MKGYINQNTVSCDFHKIQKQGNLNNILYKHTYRCDKNIKKIFMDINKSQDSDYLLGGGREMEVLECRSRCNFCNVLALGLGGKFSELIILFLL